MGFKPLAKAVYRAGNVIPSPTRSRNAHSQEGSAETPGRRSDDCGQHGAVHIARGATFVRCKEAVDASPLGQTVSCRASGARFTRAPHIASKTIPFARLIHDHSYAILLKSCR